MPRFAAILLALWAPIFPVFAQEAEPTGLLAVDGAEADLPSYLWTARPLVIFADAAADPRFSDQLQLLAEDVEALIERDIIIITDTDPTNKSEVRTRLRPRGFMLALLAKDGSVVFRKPLPWDVREISRAIDKLPLRKQELAGSRVVTD